MSLEVRAAEPEDIAELIAADAHAQANPGRRARIAEWIESGHCFVAERAGRAVGYCVLNRHWFDSFFVELVAVAEAERRTGIGTAMMEHLISLVPPGEKLWTSTNQSNTPMRSLLPRLGFVESGRIENLDDGDPELIFVRLPTW